MVKYCSIDDIYNLTPITQDEADEQTLNYYIDRATESIIKDISILVYDEEVSMEDTYFFTNNHPIADINGDTLIDSSDVKVYGWTNSDDPSTKETLSISSIIAHDGKIILATSPSGYGKITCDYSYYLCDIDLSKLNKACAYLTAYYYALKEYLFIPDRSWTFGAARFSYSIAPYMKLLHLYHVEIERLQSKIFIKKEAEDMRLIRKRMT